MGGVSTAPGFPPAPPRPPSGAGRPRRRTLRWIVAAWAAVVAAITLYSVWHFPRTAVDQSTIAQALPTVDSAAADLVRAAGTDAVPAITGYIAVDAKCRVTVVRDGARYQRWVRFYTAAGAEPALLDGIAKRLPARYDPLVAHPATGPVLHADPGNFVTVTGGIVGPGQVRVTVDTGCRPQRHPVTETGTAAGAPDRAPVAAVLAALGVQGARQETHRVVCPGGGAVWTLQAEGGSSARSLADALKQPAPVLARPDAYAYRDGDVGMAVRVQDGTVSVTATTACQ